jgi:hypothetical protein
MSRILFFVPFGGYSVHNQLDAVFAAKLQLEGATPLMVRCDGLYEHCDVLAWSGSNSKQDCLNCAASGNQLFDFFQLPSVKLRDYLTSGDYIEAENWASSLDPDQYLAASYDSLPIGLWVVSSIFSYFRINDAGLVLPEVRQVYRSFLKSGLLTYWSLRRLTAEFAPDSMVVFNGRFAPYRVAFEVSQLLGINELTHERGYYDDSFLLFDNHICLDSKPLFDIAKSWEGERLSCGQLEKTRTYLQSRENGLDLNYPSFYEFTNDFSTIRHLLRIPADAKVLAVFTSGESETTHSSGYSEVSTQFDRIDEIIELYRTRKDYLIIRHHPHMAGNAQEPPENYYLTRAYRQASRAPENVRVIMPSEKINSYALLRNVDGVISFFSSIGFEAAGRGIGVAALAQSPFSAALRYDVPEKIQDFEPLIDLLFEQTETLDPEDLRRTFRFIYAYIYRLSLQFRSFGIKNSYEMDLRIQNSAQLADGFDLELDRVCQFLLNRRPVLKTPGPEDGEVPAQDEEVFFADYIASLRRERKAIRARTKLYSASRLEPDIAVIETSAAKEMKSKTTWSDRSRYGKLVRYDCSAHFDNREGAASLSVLGDLLSSVQEGYVLIASPAVYYDEAFLSSALEHLLNDTGLTLKGVFSGAWVLDKEGLVEKEVFTKRAPNPDCSGLAALNPLFSDPLGAVSLTLFRKNSLIEVIAKAIESPGTDKAAATLSHLVRDPDIHKTLVPLALIAHN